MAGRNERIGKLELGGGPRLLFHWDGADTVTMLRMGDHETTDRYRARGVIATDIARAAELPPTFGLGHASPFFPASSPAILGGNTRYANEVAPEWLYFLDEEQQGICDVLVDRIETALLSEDVHTVDVLLGGPGTGKTSVLLQLLTLLGDSVVENCETWTIGLDVTDELARFITAATTWDLSGARQAAAGVAAGGSVDILLVDDPSSSQLVEAYFRAAKAGRVGAVVVGFDPLQLSNSLTDGELDKLVRKYAAEIHSLKACYRQKENVGKAAAAVSAVVARSTPFLSDSKVAAYAAERRELTELANGVLYKNPNGVARTYERSSVKEWSAHLDWVSAQPSPWRHWPPLLVLVDELAEFPGTWQKALDRHRHVLLPLSDIPSIKGLEFQHVALVLASSRYRDLEQGFSGSGRRLYDDYRLLRIPFSRAKDSLTVWVK